MHMTHTGEKGYVLYIPNEFAVEIYDSIMEAGLILNLIFYRNFVKFTKIYFNFQIHRYLLFKRFLK